MDIDIREIFQNLIKIEPKVVSIETLFNNEDKVKKTNYKPSYQRNYVWDDEKASYFIESILLGTEIPPLIYFRGSDKLEVVDGRQRYETILRFKDNQFKLKKNGLHKLDKSGIANKYFRSIDIKLRELFWETKLRIIEFSFHSPKSITLEMEELVKREIFKRYNSGITPLKPTDIDKAAYISDDLNSYFREKINSDKLLHSDVLNLLHFEKSSIEIILKKIRQLLVLHKIPIKYYSVKKDAVIAKYFDVLSSNTDESDIQNLFEGFIRKLNIIKQLLTYIKEESIQYNRLIFECVFWALSVVETEIGNLDKINKTVLKELSLYIGRNIDAFKMQRSSFSKEIHNRYQITSQFFTDKFGIEFTVYLLNNPEFKATNQKVSMDQREVTSFDELRINKPEPSSIVIDDIVRQMSRQRFLIRPSYQRNEVINKKKSSAIIESILLGIKLPPIFIFKRKDDISEVLDGQQRLMSILGFMKKGYMDESGVSRLSDKDNYSLNLKNGILTSLNGKKFDQLSKDDREKIENFDLWIIEINQKNNEHFESIDLFIRLNNKPYPIKEDTFEMWNSYISRDIIDSIKGIHRNNKEWFYFRKNNSRMDDENIYTALVYLQFKINKLGISEATVLKDLDIYKTGDKINFRVKSKIEISKILESNDEKENFIKACFDFEFIFLAKVKVLLTDSDEKASISENLNLILNKENNRRTQQSFYALWYFLFEFSPEVIVANKKGIRAGLIKLFKFMDAVQNRSIFDSAVQDFKKKYAEAATLISSEHRHFNTLAPVTLGAISTIMPGIAASQIVDYSPTLFKKPFAYVRNPAIQYFTANTESSKKIGLDENSPTISELSAEKVKIIVKRTIADAAKLSVAVNKSEFIFGNEVIVITLNRFGYHEKFIASILGSKFIFHIVSGAASVLNGKYVLSPTQLKNIQIPIVSLEIQNIPVKIVDLILAVKEQNLKVSGFFERLLDAIVYELYFGSGVDEYQSKVIEHLSEFAQSIKESDNDLFNKSLEWYDRFSNPNHPISIALLRLLNVQIVNDVEGSI